MPRLVYRPIYVGIDPGASGGIAVLIEDQVWLAVKMPDTDRDLIRVIEQVAERPGQKFCYVEQQTPRPTSVFDRETKKFRATILKSTCLLYANYRSICMALACHNIPFEECPPKRWQKRLNVPPKEKGEVEHDWKRRLKQRAQQMFPTANVTLATADALLIAESCRRVREGIE